MPYFPRIVDAELRASLAAAGVVLIEGPKACGKTETARQQASSEVLLDIDRAARAMAEVDPSLILEGDRPRLLDEWQVVPDLWDLARRDADAKRMADPATGNGQFILTGSAVPPDNITRHVGSGRIVRLRMRPMTSAEAGRSTGEISIASVLDGNPVRATDTGNDLRGLLDALCIGGWPANLSATPADAQRLLRGYLADVSKVDIRRVDGVRRDPRTVDRVLRSLARNVSTAATVSAIRRDVNGADGDHKDATIAEYLGALERLMVIEDLPAWAPSIRSRTRLRTAAVRHFVDPSLAVAAVRANPDRLLKDLNWTGLLFENMVVRDLRVYADALGAQVFSYRDESGLEADAVVELRDGRWAAFEVKLGLGEVDSAAANLLKLRDRVDTRVAGEPVALAVVVGSGYGYTRPDGVSLIPIRALAA